MINSKDNSHQVINYLVLIAFIAKIIVNYLSNALPINGFTPGQLSDLYPNQFVPAGFTFSIWGIIYLSCAVFVVQTFRKNFEPNIKVWFVIVCLINISWLFAWHYQFIALSLIIMIAFLCTLIYGYQMIRKSDSTRNDNVIKVTSSLYLGWISVATAANITTSMVHNNLLIGSQETEGIITLILCMIILGITAYMISRYSDFIYALVVTWQLLAFTPKELQI